MKQSYFHCLKYMSKLYYKIPSSGKPLLIFHTCWIKSRKYPQQFYLNIISQQYFTLLLVENNFFATIVRAHNISIN